MRWVADQDAVLKHADEIVPEIELEQAFAEQRMFGAGSEFPAALGHKIFVSAADLVGREIRRAHEIVEIELRDGPANRGLGVPAAARLPVDRQVRFQELQRPIGVRIARHLEVGEFVIHAAVDAQRRRERSCRR